MPKLVIICDIDNKTNTMRAFEAMIDLIHNRMGSLIKVTCANLECDHHIMLSQCQHHNYVMAQYSIYI